MASKWQHWIVFISMGLSIHLVFLSIDNTEKNIKGKTEPSINQHQSKINSSDLHTFFQPINSIQQVKSESLVPLSRTTCMSPPKPMVTINNWKLQIIHSWKMRRTFSNIVAHYDEMPQLKCWNVCHTFSFSCCFFWGKNGSNRRPQVYSASAFLLEWWVEVLMNEKHPSTFIIQSLRQALYTIYIYIYMILLYDSSYLQILVTYANPKVVCSMSWKSWQIITNYDSNKEPQEYAYRWTILLVVNVNMSW